VAQVVVVTVVGLHQAQLVVQELPVKVTQVGKALQEQHSVAVAVAVQEKVVMQVVLAVLAVMVVQVFHHL
jgi:uncharacterized protein YaaW (UPF0174 family)